MSQKDVPANQTPYPDDRNGLSPTTKAVEVEPGAPDASQPAAGGVDATPSPQESGGYMHPSPSSFPAVSPHDLGTPMDQKDAQYGAAPVRSARYDEDHQNRRDAAARPGQPSGHSGAQARLPTRDEQASEG